MKHKDLSRVLERLENLENHLKRIEWMQVSEVASKGHEIMVKSKEQINEELYKQFYPFFQIAVSIWIGIMIANKDYLWIAGVGLALAIIFLINKIRIAKWERKTHEPLSRENAKIREEALGNIKEIGIKISNSSHKIH